MSNAYRDWQADEIHELTQQLGDSERQIDELEDMLVNQDIHMGQMQHDIEWLTELLVKLVKRRRQ